MISVNAAMLHTCRGVMVIFLLCVNCLLLPLAGCSAPVDGTLKPGWSGINVVTAVVEKIDVSNVFDNPNSEWFLFNRENAKDFLRILAYIRTEYGRRRLNPVTTMGGLWNITKNEFDTTKAYMRQNSALWERILNSPMLHVDWVQDVAYTNLSIPMYSGLATVLLLDKILREDVTLIRYPGELWKRYFGGISTAEWTEATSNASNATRKSVLQIVTFCS